jgi:flagellar hook-associated protein 2
VDAEVVIDGITVTRSSNTFTIDGITYTLNETTKPEANIGFRLTQNVDKAVESIKGFVDAYNLLIIKLDTLLIERKNSSERGYTPLTEDEKKAMSDEQIEKWEAIAKKGLLYNDRSIRSMLDRLRRTLYATVSEAGISPAQIGIKTGHWANKGQITLDEDALRAALENDPHQVMSVFTSISSSDDASVKYSENGILKRISDVFDSYTKSSGMTLASLGENIEDMVEKIDMMEEKMLELEEKYYQKYAVMERALAKLQSQSDWLNSMLGSLTYR